MAVVLPLIQLEQTLVLPTPHVSIPNANQELVQWFPPRGQTAVLPMATVSIKPAMDAAVRLLILQEATLVLLISIVVRPPTKFVRVMFVR